MEKGAKKNTELRFLLTAAACVLLVFLVVGLILPAWKLGRARKLAAAGDYEKAYALIGGMYFQDSAALAEECLFEAQKARLGAAKVGDTLRFGVYEQDNRAENGPEELEWLVLAVEGDKALLVSRYGLEPRPYNEELYMTDSRKKVTWSTCELRTWLNGDFFGTAFSPEHQALILMSEVKADKNPGSDVNPGRDTKDRVFILSASEAGRYFDSDAARRCPASASCLARSRETENGYCRWWLRTTGVADDSSVAVVTASGGIFLVGFSCGHVPYPAVRPAMWIALDGR